MALLRDSEADDLEADTDDLDADADEALESCEDDCASTEEARAKRARVKRIFVSSTSEREA
jgi:hypothetical protein